ncbi:universal stress protein [Yoonia sp.]|uniref:universal stress protein n=1 Tax=Yoonia sp. TaxID=2212373 RepID=UPI0019FDB041|nr:universal stress protein [Yoonia sp.]MBE0412981.1 universal stress protein [Yoonia sp.]
MQYQAIATILHQRDLENSALNVAIEAARRWGAHLHILCLGVHQADSVFYHVGASALSVQENIKVAQEDAIALEAQVRDRLAQEDIAWDVQAGTVIFNGLDAFLADHMRFHDLVILPSPYREGAQRIDVTIFEACTFGADMPVLIVPKTPVSLDIKKVQLGWDDGREAMAASLAALPLLQVAKHAEIVLIDPPRHSADRSDPGGRLAQHLARHGVKPEIFILSKTHESIAAQLLRRAHERDIDMIVMGAYGHSRLREAVMGGPTRNMLQIADVPLLMAR